MALQLAAAAGGQAWAGVRALVEADGSADHPFVARLTAPLAARRDLADAVHALCAVHGGLRGLIEEALNGAATGVAAAWLDEAARAFARERALLARVVSAAGPLPSTPGQAATETALVGQRHAFQMLGRSDRRGCALGAAAALLLDWPAIRRVIDRAADTFGAEPEALRLPDPAETATVVELVAEGPAAERALGFGARELLAQHRGLWDLLETRAGAREG